MYKTSHRRFNPLTREWVLVSAQRSERPWLGQVETPAPSSLPAYDPDCYLCPGNIRTSGIKNPDYSSTFVFDNDFPSLLPDSNLTIEEKQHPLLREEPESGVCRVVCFSPRHDLTLPDLPINEVEGILDTWTEESEQLGNLKEISYVQVFENKGAMLGCSNPHPHSQIWATASIPNEPAKELISQQEYYAKNKTPLLLDYGSVEKSKERLITSNEYFSVLVPFWAIWPFEVLMVANQPIARLADCSAPARKGLAAILSEVTQRYDRLFNISFPYSMGFHQAPYDGNSHPEWILHAHFYPPLLRSATIRKFMVGYELLAMPQRDLTAESAAERLRSIKL
jgi:UDPglucose--hexose-1-phosphate uridylyltransferase